MTTDTKATYQAQLPEGATVVGWNESWVLSNPAFFPFPNRPYVAHPVRGEKISGSGQYDLTGPEATALTGIPA